MQKTQDKYMSEKLKEDYERSQKQGNLGHVIGFYQDKPECVAESYEFVGERYTLRRQHGNFFWWDYDAKNKGKDERPRFHKRVGR